MVPLGVDNLKVLLAGLESAAVVLPSLQRGSPVALARSPARVVALVKIINISDNKGEIDWDLLEEETFGEEMAE